MIIFKETLLLRKKVAQLKESGKKIGFVPTMGALHEGHISLIKASLKKCDITVVSIFVNPTQFNDPKDFEKYPVTIENDILLLEKTGCDILFAPAVEEMYPGGALLSNHYELGDIEYVLEGKYRPGHFQGVCQVVHQLLTIVTPGYLFMGMKDYQQCLVIKKLVQVSYIPVEVIIENTAREQTGLAMSSRNLRLSEEQKEKAAGIYAMLVYIKNNYTTLPAANLEKHATEYLLNNGFDKTDYVTIANAETLQPIQQMTNGIALIALIAAFMGGVRLIDNMIITA